ncbi:AraC family ligand binding domain-containing protein [Marinomonas epiphytica]
MTKHSASGLSYIPSNEQIRRAQHQHVLARQYDMKAGYEGKRHCHAWFQLMYSANGLLNVELEGQLMVVPPQRAIWLPPNCEHKVTTPQGAQFRSLYFRPEKVASLGQERKAFTVTPLIKELILAIVERCDTNLEWQESDERLLLVLLDQLVKQPSKELSLLMPSDHRVLGLVQEIQQNPCNHTGLEQWAERLGVSSRTISRIFLSQTGIGFKEWRQRVRLLHSLSLLEQGVSVTQVAFDVGYQSSSAFSYAFQQFFHQSPKKYYTP